MLPGCLLPCVETHIKTVFIDEKSTEGTKRDTSTRFDIAFSTTVRTFINDFPSFSFSSFLAATGGAIGSCETKLLYWNVSLGLQVCGWVLGSSRSWTSSCSPAPGSSVENRSNEKWTERLQLQINNWTIRTRL